MSAGLTKIHALQAGDRVDVAAFSKYGDERTPSPGGRFATLTLAVAGTDRSFANIKTSTAQQVAPTTPVVELWVRLTDVNDARSVVPKVQDAIADEAIGMSGRRSSRRSTRRSSTRCCPSP